MNLQVSFGATGNFSLLPDVHDILTFDDLISILICIIIGLMNRVRVTNYESDSSLLAQILANTSSSKSSVFYSPVHKFFAIFTAHTFTLFLQ